MLGAGEAFADDLALEGAALFEGEVLVVLGQPGLALIVYQQYETDPHHTRTLSLSPSLPRPLGGGPGLFNPFPVTFARLAAARNLKPWEEGE